MIPTAIIVLATATRIILSTTTWSTHTRYVATTASAIISVVAVVIVTTATAAHIAVSTARSVLHVVLETGLVVSAPLIATVALRVPSRTARTASAVSWINKKMWMRIIIQNCGFQSGPRGPPGVPEWLAGVPRKKKEKKLGIHGDARGKNVWFRKSKKILTCIKNKGQKINLGKFHKIRRKCSRKKILKVKN